MVFMSFSDWALIREQQVPGVPAAQKAPQASGSQSAVKAPSKPSAADMEIKQVIAANITKPKQARSAALMALAKKKQSDPKSTPQDLQAIADAMGETGSP